MPSACFDANSNVSTHWKHAEGMSLRYGVIVLGSLMRFFYQEFILSSVFFRRETASGFYPWGNVVSPRERVAEGLCGWRHGTRFQWRKAHSRTAKCEAFHFAPRLFFMFLFLIPFTIRQQCIIYPQKFLTEPWFPFSRFLLILGAKKRLCRFVA